MSKALQHLFSELEIKLAELKQNQCEISEQANNAILLVEEYINLIQDKLLTYQFSSSESEIDFFKLHYVKLYQYYFYYKTIISIENEKFLKCLTKKQEIDFYSNCLTRLNTIHDEEVNVLREFHALFNKQQKKLFLRKHYRWRRKNLLNAVNETFVTNSITLALAKRNSIEDVTNYIDNKITGIKSKENRLKTNLKWTGSKVLLMELIYALFLVGIINNGKVELTELVTFFENTFDIDLNNHNNIIQDIKARKTNRTKFLDMMKSSLTLKFED